MMRSSREAGGCLSEQVGSWRGWCAWCMVDGVTVFHVTVFVVIVSCQRLTKLPVATSTPSSSNGAALPHTAAPENSPTPVRLAGII